MVLFVQQAIIFSLTLIPVAVTALALLGCFTEFIASYLEPDFANINYDYIIGKNHVNILTSKVKPGLTNYQPRESQKNFYLNWKIEMKNPWIKWKY